MRFQVITLFPELVLQGCAHGVVGQAIAAGKIQVEAINPRSFTSDVHKSVDDRPFGGGDGMIMIPEPLTAAVEKAVASSETPPRRLYLSARGRPFDDAFSRELATETEILLLCGRYGGVDQRFLEAEKFEEVSIGNYVLSGGELAALVLIDAIGRHRPGVLGNSASSFNESFSDGLLEAPQFTRPREWRGIEVPEVLLSGNHAKIEEWRKHIAVLLTAQARPDLLDGVDARQAREALKALSVLSENDRVATGLRDADQVREHLERRAEMK